MVEMENLIHIGTPKTGTTFLQNNVFPNISSASDRILFLGKKNSFILNNKKNERPQYIIEPTFLLFNERIRLHPFLSTIEKKFYKSIMDSIKKHNSEKKINYIFSNELITGFSSTRRIFNEKLQFFQNIGYDGEYWVVLRDPESFLCSLIPSWIYEEKLNDRIFYLTENQNLDSDSVINLASSLLRHHILHSNGDSIIYNLLNYSNIINQLPKEKLWVSHYENTMEKNSSIKSFLSMRYNYNFTHVDDQKRENTQDITLSKIVNESTDINFLKKEIRGLTKHYFRKFLSNHKIIQDSQRIYEKLNHQNKTILAKDIRN